MGEDMYELYLQTHATAITGRQITLEDMKGHTLEQQVVIALAAYDASPTTVMRTRQNLRDSVEELLGLVPAKTPKKAKETLS